MDIEHKAFGTSVETGDAGEITALVSCFNNVDLGNERVMPGAFKNSLARKLPKGVWNHDWSKPCAKTLAAYETPEGLVVKAQFNLDTQIGREAFSNIKFYGAEQEFSIGYTVVKDSIEEKSGVRELHELRLHEFSPVLVGMNDSTALLSVKAENAGSDGAPALRLAEHSEAVLAACEEFANRIKSLRDLRAKEGRVISAATRGRIESCVASMQAVIGGLGELMSMSEPTPKSAEADIRRVYAECLKTISASQGVS